MKKKAVQWRIKTNPQAQVLRQFAVLRSTCIQQENEPEGLVSKNERIYSTDGGVILGHVTRKESHQVRANWSHTTSSQRVILSGSENGYESEEEMKWGRRQLVTPSVAVALFS